MIVDPTPAQQAEAWSIATQRDASKPRSINQRFTPHQTDVQINYHGVLAEIVVAELLGYSVDRSISLHGDLGHDLVATGKPTVQVKYNNYGRRAYLYFSEGKDPISDVLVLVTTVTWSSDVLDVVGWMSREEFREVATVVNFGYGARRGVHRLLLRNIDSLRQVAA